LHILLTVNFSPWSAYSGGGQRSTHELASALARRGHDTTVVYTKPPWEHVAVPADLPYDLTWAGFFAPRSRSGSPLRSLNAVTVVRTVRQLLDLSRGDDVVVHSQGEEGALLPRLRRTHRFGFVITPRYPAYPATAAAWQRLVMPPKFRALGAGLAGADRWCPTSEAAAAEVRATYPVSADRCRIVPNGLAGAFLNVERRAEATQGPIVFHGRLSPAKGAQVLIQALAKLGPDAPDCVICGRGPEEARLRALGKQLGVRVELAGWQTPEQMAERLAGARLAVLPSREESFGNAMAEAMAAGAPLISTRSGSIPEVVPEGTGVLVPPDDPDALAEAMRGLLADDARREALGRAGCAHARGRYSWDATAAAFEQIYADVLDGLKA